MFYYSKHVKGLVMKEYKYDRPHSRRQALSLDLVFSASSFFTNNMHACFGSPYIVLSSTNGYTQEKLTKEFLVQFLQFLAMSEASPLAL